MHHDTKEARRLAGVDLTGARAAAVTSAITAALCGLLAGCGGGSSAPPMPAMSTVTLVISSDADDRFMSYALELQGITLTNAAGKTVTLFSAPSASAPSSSSSSSSSSSTNVTQNLEFVHVNGKIEPHLTVTIPQDTYTSAAITLRGGLEATCPNTSDLLVGNLFLGAQSPVATVTVPEPLVVNAESAAMMLKLLISQSGTIDCAQAVPAGEEVDNAMLTPAFTLSTLALSTTPTNPQDGEVDDLQGQVQTIDGQTAEILLANNVDSSPVAINADSATVFDGVSSLQDLTAREFVIVSGALQADGSVRATRVTVRDPLTGSALSGPVLAMSTLAAGDLQLSLVDNLISGSFNGASVYATDSGTALSILDAPDNLTSLPLKPGATITSLLPGQNVYATNSGAVFDFPLPPNNEVVGTAAILPQTIDAQISSIGSSGNFTVYTVSLASYDSFVLLAAVPGQLTQLAAPGTVTVYVDDSTQVLSSQTPAVGDTLRFYGLVLNNSGTLAMDCIRILDGVPFDPSLQQSASARLQRQPAAERRLETGTR